MMGMKERTMKLHPGPRIDRIPVEGVGGLILAITSVLIFLIGLPEVRVFFLFGLAGGLAVAGLLRLLR